MKLPPFLMGAALLFWGWHSRLLIVAVPLALLIETARVTRLRWDFSLSDYQRVWNGCLVLLLAAVMLAVGYSQSLGDNAAAGSGGREWNESMPLATLWALLFFQWWPMVFAPFVLASAFGQQPSFPLTVFSWLARRHSSGPEPHSSYPARRISIEPLYFAIVMVSSSTSHRPGWAFFIGFLLLVGWALWPRRSLRLPTWGWLTILLAAGSLGFCGQVGLSQLQRYLMSLDAPWLQRFYQSRVDPLESRTMIGSIGRLKLSGRIVLRISTTNDMPAELVREASYDKFKYSTWSVSSGGRGDPSKLNLDWRSVSSEENLTGWRLAKDAPEKYEMRVSQFLRNGGGLLPLPNGTVSLEDLPVGAVNKNHFGGVKVSEAPNLINYRIRYGNYSTLDGPPTDRDIEIQADEKALIKEYAKELNLMELAQFSQKEVLRLLHSHFRNKFRYSSYLETPHDRPGKMTPLGHFLFRQRTGHCEFFATATALLLRAAGIHTRYAVGYSVQESAGPGRYVVRERHAHAWCLVWSKEDQSWHDFDTTPPQWNTLESENASFWEPLSDLGSRLWLEYSQWRTGRSEMTKYAVYGLSSLFLLFVLRLFYAKRRRRLQLSARKEDLEIPTFGKDSEYYALEQKLAKKGWGRRVDETPLRWLQRLADLWKDTPVLDDILDLHYRLRFDPAGLEPKDRARLRDRVAERLRDLEATSDLNRRKQR